MPTNTSTSITAIDGAEWDALVGDGAPFLRHAFLAGLEASGCVGGRTGWTPAPVTLRDERGLAAAAPVYIKTHSYGEFVFDFAWAQAYAQHGLEYYPKLVIGVPFTPATAPRLLVRPDVDAAAARAALIAAIQGLAEARGVSSIHGLFLADEDRAAFERAGWLSRFDVQFHWSNPPYDDYDQFLEKLTAKYRKNARRERRRIAESGLTCETLLGTQLGAADIAEVYELQRDTFLRHGHHPYFTRAFFELLPGALGDNLMIKRARAGAETVAIAMFYWNQDALYGRNWGTHAQHHSLHFELCYHQGIDFCIERGIRRFEPGTGGEFKVTRGFVPTRTWSAHWIVDPQFRRAIGDYLVREGVHVDRYAHEVAQHVPYRDARREARGE